MKSKVAYVISDVDRWMSFEWIRENLSAQNVDIYFYTLSSNRGFFDNYLAETNSPHHWIRCKGKLHIIKAIIILWAHFIKYRFDVVHCHFLNASICGLTAARMSGIKQRIYTRHHSTFHHLFAKKGVFIDKYCNYLASEIVAISKVVKQVLIEYEGVRNNKIVMINHGFNFQVLRRVYPDRINAMKDKYSLNSTSIVGVISRFIEWKGVQYIIPAFKKYLEKFPDAILILVNARGPYEPDILAKLKGLEPDSYRLIPFENDIFTLMQTFDYFVHVPVDSKVEAFGQVYVEALALGIPSVFTISGIAHEFIEHKSNAMIVEPKNHDAINEALIQLSQEPTLRQKISEQGVRDVTKQFDFEAMAKDLEHLYTCPRA
ncbi:MAG: glycosyltransferase family 4 protein [Cyclobacteriaceae bacterium]